MNIYLLICLLVKSQVLIMAAQIIIKSMAKKVPNVAHTLHHPMFWGINFLVALYNILVRYGGLLYQRGWSIFFNLKFAHIRLHQMERAKGKTMHMVMNE